MGAATWKILLTYEDGGVFVSTDDDPAAYLHRLDMAEVDEVCIKRVGSD